jgi:hypothetical protein
VAIPQFWNFILVPEQLDEKGILQRMTSPSVKLAPWKFCDESKEDEDVGPDTVDIMLDKLNSDLCHGRDFNHLLWDFKVVFDRFNSFKPVGIDRDRFVMTDGGLVMLIPSSEESKTIPDLNPYNSTLYKLAILSDTPVLSVQTFVNRQVIPIYIHASDMDDEEHADDIEMVSDGQPQPDSTSNTTTTPPPSIVMKARPPTIHLAKAVRVKDGDLETVVGVAGVELSASYLQSLLLNATSNQGDQLDCQNNSDIFCCLIDTSGYVLTSNRDDSDVAVGDFLGVADPQLMHHLLSKDFFTSRVEFNYQALCPTEIDCHTDGVADLPRLFVVSFLRQIWTLVNQLAHSTVVAIALLINLPATEVKSASEYTKQVTEGLHRCTTKSEHWQWGPKAPSKYHHFVEETCKGNRCERDFHFYRLHHLNGLLIISDPRCDFCKTVAIFDGPLEGTTYITKKLNCRSLLLSFLPYFFKCLVAKTVCFPRDIEVDRKNASPRTMRYINTLWV